MSTSSDTTPTVLVVGATGTVGRHLVRALLDAGARVRALVRHPLTAGLPDDVELATGDLTRPDTVARAAHGADAAFLLWMGFDARGADATVAALAGQVARIVYLSAAELQEDRVGVKDGPWAEVESAIAASGAEWTFLRAGGFAANTLGWSAAFRAGTPVELPYPEAVRSPVHERDIADVAARCLLEPGHGGRAYDITGPEQLTLRRQAELVAEALGRPVVVTHQDRAAAEAATAGVVGEEYAAAALAYWATLETSPERASDDVARVLGRPARTFAVWAADHADDFRPLTVAEVARRYADGFRTGDVGAATALLDPDVVRVAPLENDGVEVEVRGPAAIMANASARNEGVELEGVTVSEPMIGREAFAIRFDFEERLVRTGARRRTTKMSMCAVDAGRIVREDVFYATAPS